MRDLGVLLDEKLTFGPHVDYIVPTRGEPSTRTLKGTNQVRIQGWALGRAPTPRDEFHHTKCTIQ